MDKEMVPDEQIAGAVITRLTHDGRLRNKASIKVDVEEGVVQLYGEVDDPLEKDVAGNLASTTPGVKEVVNSLGIVMDKPVLTDRDIAKAVEEALGKETGFTLKDIGAKVDDGIVTLVGLVNTEEQVEEALRAAGRVKGVKQVISTVRIGEAEPEETISIVDDALIKSLVASALDNNDIELSNDKTAVAGGRVFLRGNVNTEDEKKRATDVVRSVRGVRKVRNELVVWMSETSSSADEVLSATVEHALGDNPNTSAAYVEVLCTDGVAHLFGQVDSIEQRNAAIETAQKVEGVRKVTDDIIITDRTTEKSEGKGAIPRRKTRR